MERRMNRKVHVRCEVGENEVLTGKVEDGFTYHYRTPLPTF